MKSLAPWLLALLLACASAGAGVWGYREHQRYEAAARDSDFYQTQARLKQSDNERLEATIGKQNKEIAASYESAQQKAIEQQVVAIRGLNFKEPVQYETLSHDNIIKVFAEKMAEQTSDEDFKHSAASLAAFGIVEPNYPLKEKYLALLGEQVAAFYDQHKHKLYMFDNSTLHNIQNRVVLAHELTHALQDQNFGLLRMPVEVKDDDDLVLATTALIEGDATQLMADYEAKTMSLQTFTDSIAGALSQNMQQYERSPRFIRETLVFPYTHGKQFCEALYERGGYQAISAAFSRPPTSTTQILHPEKYFAHEEPIRVEWPDTALSGKKPTDDNVMGEFSIRLLFYKFMDEATADYAAEGWRGDRYLVYDDGQGFVWETLWQDNGHMRNYRDALETYVQKRFKKSGVNSSDADNISFSSPSIPAVKPGAPDTPAYTGEIVSPKSGNEVILIWGATKEMNDSLVAKFKQ